MSVHWLNGLFPVSFSAFVTSTQVLPSPTNYHVFELAKKKVLDVYTAAPFTNTPRAKNKMITAGIEPAIS